MRVATPSRLMGWLRPLSATSSGFRLLLHSHRGNTRHVTAYNALLEEAGDGPC